MFITITREGDKTSVEYPEGDGNIMKSEYVNVKIEHHLKHGRVYIKSKYDDTEYADFPAERTIVFTVPK